MSIAYKRKFGKLTYTLRTHSHTKRKAQEIAETIRKAGKLARVVRIGDAYAVYGHP